MSARAELRVAVVGAGPAGLYAAEALLLAEDVSVEVDIVDRLPTPYGLVRYGVAPDHPTIKSVVSSLADILQQPGVRFLGGLDIGTDIELDDLRACYDAVLYATGAPRDRRLDIPGEDLDGSVSATEFVAWYNGHPDAATDRALKAENVVVVGAGNVALDIARVLARPYEDIARTDVPTAVLERLRTNAARHVHVLARRGPEHVRFSTKELRELGTAPGIHAVVDPAQLAHEVTDPDRRIATNLKVLREWSRRPEATGDLRTVRFHFFTSPVEILGGDRVEAVRIERFVIDAASGATVRTGELTTLPAGLVVRAVGYRGAPVGDLPFDDAAGLVPNTAGRIDGPGSEYVAGWIKRGPTGVIGTNKVDARETVQSLLDDRRSGRLPTADRPRLDDRLAERGITVVPFDGWQAIDRAEQEQGIREGRTRSKITDWQTLRELGRTTVPSAPGTREPIT